MFCGEQFFHFLLIEVTKKTIIIFETSMKIESTIEITEESIEFSANDEYLEK